MEFKPELKVVTERGDLGREFFQLLLAVELSGSLKGASEALKMPYSTAWNTLARAERILGVKIVEASKRGGTTLTDRGRELLRRYMAEAGKMGLVLGLSDFIYAGSHDPIVEAALQRSEAYFVGSMRGLLLVSEGLAHFGGIHLGDNVQAVRIYGGGLRLIHGFKREVGVASRRELRRLRDIVGLKIVNRQPGSGTRLHIDRVLSTLGLTPEKVPGYDRIAPTHDEAARIVAEGEADYTITLRYVAERYGLYFMKLWDEEFDFVCRRGLERRVAQFVRELELGPGYAPKPNMGRVEPTIK